MSVKNKVATSSLICYFIIVVIFAMVRMLSAFGVFDGLGAEADYIFNVIIQVVILFSLSILLFSLFQKNKIKDTFRFFGCKKINGKAVLISIAIGVVVYFLNIFVATFFNSILSLFGYSASSSTTYMESYPFWLFIVNILITAVLPGICEEIAHRGLLLKGMSGLGQAKALILSSLLFGFMHMNIQQFFYATLIGFLVGYLALICDSIYPAMIIHFMNNALSVFAGYSSFNNLGFEKIIESLNVILQSNIILGFLFVVLFLVALVYLLMILIKLLFRETTMKNMKKLQLQIMKQLLFILSIFLAVGCTDKSEPVKTDLLSTVPQYVQYEKSADAFCIAAKGKATAVCVSSEDWEGVVRAAGDLVNDIRMVSGAEPQLIKNTSSSTPTILIGTIGKSPLIDQLVSEGKLDVSAVKGQWESFLIQTVDGNLVVAGSDKRGTIYGIYDISEK